MFFVQTTKKDFIWIGILLVLVISLIGNNLIFWELTLEDEVIERSFPFSLYFIKSNFSLWQSFRDSGTTVFSDTPWMGPFYPGFILFLLFSPFTAVKLGFLLHALLAAVFTFILAKYYKLSRLASFVSALLYTLSSNYSVHINEGYLPEAISLSFLPALILFWELSFSKCLKYSAAAGAVVALMILGGHPTNNLVYLALLSPCLFAIAVKKQSFLYFIKHLFIF